MQTDLYSPETWQGTTPYAPDALQANDWDTFFTEASELSEGEIVAQLGTTFDDLAARVAEGPTDEEAVAAVRSLLVEVKARGYVDQAMQMAMTIGAMACNHNHMQELAKDASQILFGEGETPDTHASHEHSKTKEESHDVKSCADCRAGRQCRRK